MSWLLLLEAFTFTLSGSLEDGPVYIRPFLTQLLQAAYKETSPSFPFTLDDVLPTLSRMRVCGDNVDLASWLQVKEGLTFCSIVSSFLPCRL